MGRKNNSVLRPSVPDTIKLSQAVTERFPNLLQSHFRIKKEVLLPPPSLSTAMVLWRTMHLRFDKGDFRNSRDELLAVREVAEWTNEENAKLRNQPIKKIAWRD